MTRLQSSRSTFTVSKQYPTTSVAIKPPVCRRFALAGQPDRVGETGRAHSGAGVDQGPAAGDRAVGARVASAAGDDHALHRLPSVSAVAGEVLPDTYPERERASAKGERHEARAVHRRLRRGEAVDALEADALGVALAD